MRCLPFAAAAVAALLLAASCSRRGPAGERFSVEVMNASTPVKDQGRSDGCWAYAMLSAIETEHIMRGDSVHLSVAYALRSAVADGFRRSYLGGGADTVALRGTAMTLISTIAAHGIVPYDAYGRGDAQAAAVAARQAGRMAASAVRRRTGLAAAERQLGAMLDETMGPVPARVFMLGAEYTPQEFARSVCAPGEYVALTSFTHHPFYADFALEVADNSGREPFFNVPIDTLMTRLERAVRAGRGVCWEGDVTEPGFSFGRGGGPTARGRGHGAVRPAGGFRALPYHRRPLHGRGGAGARRPWRAFLHHEKLVGHGQPLRRHGLHGRELPQAKDRCRGHAGRRGALTRAREGALWAQTH